MWKMTADDRESIFKTAEEAISVAHAGHTKALASIKKNTWSASKTNYPSWLVTKMLEDKHAKIVATMSTSYGRTAEYRFSIDVPEVRAELNITEDKPSTS